MLLHVWVPSSMVEHQTGTSGILSSVSHVHDLHHVKVDGLVLFDEAHASTTMEVSLSARSLGLAKRGRHAMRSSLSGLATGGKLVILEELMEALGGVESSTRTRGWRPSLR